MSSKAGESTNRVGPNNNAKLTFVNSLAWSFYTMTLEEKRILSWLISEIRMTDNNFKTHTLDLTELNYFLGFTKGGRNYIKASEATKRLVGRVVEIQIAENGETSEIIQFPFISKAHYKLRGDGTVSMRLNDAAAPYLLNIAGNYTELEFRILMTFQSFYSCRLYEIAKCEINKSHKKQISFYVSLDKARDVFGIQEDQYEVFGNFSERVLKPACKEVSKKSDVDVTFATRRVGRKVGKIELRIRKKPATEIAFSKTTFAPGSRNDRLCVEMQELGMPKREAYKTIDRWCEKDPMRVGWHVRLTKQMIRKKKIRVSPLAFLRAGIKNDYRSTKADDMREAMDDLRKREIERKGPRLEGMRSLGERMDFLRDIYRKECEE